MLAPPPFDPEREILRLHRDLASQEPAEFRRAYLARLEEGRLVWPGTTVPRLGVIPAAQTASGLIVPATAVAGPAPIDAMSTYLTSTEVFGRPLTDAELEPLLRSATDEHFIMEAATWLARLEHHGSLDVDLQLEAAGKMFTEPTRTKVQNLIRTGYRLLAPQVLLAVIKAALLVSPAGTPARADNNTGPNPFTLAMLGVADRLGVQGNGNGGLWGSYPADLSLEVARNQSFNADHNFGSLLARYQRLWHDLPGQLAGEPGAVDVEEVFAQVTGVALDDLLLVGAPAIGGAARGQVRFERGYFYDNIPLPKATMDAGRGGRLRRDPIPGAAVGHHRPAGGDGGAGGHLVRRRHAHWLAPVPQRGRPGDLGRGCWHLRHRRRAGCARPRPVRSDWWAALLLGTALAPTDPAVVFSVLGRREVAGRSGTILEGESGANDPVGIALLASLLAAGPAAGLDAAGSVAAAFLLQLAVGAAVGVAGGVLLVGFMRRVPLPSEGLYSLRVLAGALVIYGAATLAHGSGFLAVFVAGILAGDARAPYKGEIERFHGALASLAEIVAFLVLGLTIGLHTLPDSGALGMGLVLAVLLTVVVRPLGVGLVLLPVRLAWGERLFVLWAGLKGAVPILLGSFLLTAQVPNASRLYGVIIVVVAFSVIVQGGLVPVVATRLGVPMRTVEPEPWSLGVRFRHEPQGLRRHVVATGSPADGCRIGDLDVGEDVWISFVIRDDQLVPVNGATTLRAGDEILALTDPERGPDLAPIFTARPDTGQVGSAPA